MRLRFFYFLLILLAVTPPGQAADPARCSPSLWTIKASPEQEVEAIAHLKKMAKKALRASPAPVTHLGSAGKTDLHDAQLLASRRALKDADYAAILGLMFYLTQDPLYFNHARAFLMQWAQVNHPTGNPIDETRLEGMVWAYDLISCSLSREERAIILHWFSRMRTQKLAWKWGPMTRLNNHHTHQLKMLLLLDKILGNSASWQTHQTHAEQFTRINLNAQTGESVDYLQRTALYYHNYDLQAWLEIQLITGCCQKPVDQAFHFLTQRIQSHQLSGEFLHSSAPIDAQRSQAGFAYAKQGGTFDASKAAATIVLYYTSKSEAPPADLWSLVENAKPAPWLVFLKTRRDLWPSSNTESVPLRTSN